jgi:hypothetical protein
MGYQVNYAMGILVRGISSVPNLDLEVTVS